MEQKKTTMNLKSEVIHKFAFKSPERYSREFLVGVCRPVLQILTRFQTNKCNFLHPGADPGFFLGGGTLVSCSTSTPINHIVFFLFSFFFAEYQLY